MSLFRPNVESIEGYVPGEQPQERGWVKLNTNENPYAPSPQVTEAVRAAAQGRLHVYPDPLATEMRQTVAQLFGLAPDWVLPANGSDECLTILMRTFVDPDQLVCYPYPSYVLYETLADLQAARHERLYLNADWSWDLETIRPTVEQSKLVFVPNPNSPSGNRWTAEELLALVPPRGILVLDEAYGDFCDVPHRAELLHSDLGRRIVITRTLSKSYSLAGIRSGFTLAHPDLIAGMRKVKDSYNCNSLSLAATVAALKDQQWMQANVAKICSTRSRFSERARQLGFHVVDSQTNFVWCTLPERKVQQADIHHSVFEKLKERRILVRYMSFSQNAADLSRTNDGLRVTVGTDGEIDQLVQALTEIL